MDIVTNIHVHISFSSYHSAPLKLHLGGIGWDVVGVVEMMTGSRRPSVSSISAAAVHHMGPLYDSVFVLSSGRVTSIGPQGEFNWQVCVYVCAYHQWRKNVASWSVIHFVPLEQVDTTADWDFASEVIYTPEQQQTQKKDPNQVKFIHSSFVPSAVPFSLQSYGKKVSDRAKNCVHMVQRRIIGKPQFLHCTGPHLNHGLAVVCVAIGRGWLHGGSPQASLSPSGTTCSV